MSLERRPLLVRLLPCVAVLLAAGSVRASAQAGSGDGFLFGAPAGAVTFNGGYARANEGSEIWSFARDQLTLKKGDFSSFTLAVEYAHYLSSRVDIFAGVGYAGVSRQSEFRDWVDQDDLPIVQTTSLYRVPISGGVRFYPLSRGYSVGSFAWVPSSYSPFVSAGAGFLWYSFSQDGDFVDFQDNEIFSDRFEASGFTWTAHAGGGLDMSVSPTVVLTGEARYSWATAPMGEDFSGFDAIDLSGLSATFGVRIRF